MPLQDVFQPRFVNVGLLEHLLNPRLVLGAPHAGGDGHDVFGSENLGGYAFVVNAPGLAHGFLGQAGGGKELHWESSHQQMFGLDLPALRLQVCVDGGNSGGEPLVLGNEKNVRVVSGERLDVINRRERPAATKPFAPRIRQRGRLTATSISALFFAIMFAGRMPRQKTFG